MLSEANGMLHTYNGNGFTKIVKLDMSDPNYFRNTMVEEVINTGWVSKESTLSIIIQLNVYNPNLFIVNQKRIVIEFLETGGIINLEHDSILTNMRLYREP